MLWPDLQIVHGRSRKPSTQGSVERANGDFQPMLGAWMRENKNIKWSVCLPLVNHQITNLPPETKKKIKTVKVLYSVLSGIFNFTLLYTCINNLIN